MAASGKSKGKPAHATYKFWPRTHGHWYHPNRRHHVALFVGGVGILLKPNRENIIMVDMTVGQKVALSIKFLDASGNEITPAPTLDAAPTWSDTTPATDTLTQSADGLTASAAAIAAGSDTVQVSLAIGGSQFTATLPITVTTPVPKVASIEIVAGTPA